MRLRSVLQQATSIGNGSCRNQAHLAIEHNVAPSTQTVALSAMLFLYRHVLHIDLPYIDVIEQTKKTERLPIVFSRSEVKQILAYLDG